MFHAILILVFACVSLSQQQEQTSTAQRAKPDSTAALVTFQQHIVPLLKANCSPCHFEGGQVYDRYPFDDYATVKRLGAKLNTRLKEQEQKTLLTDWLKSGAKEK